MKPDELRELDARVAEQVMGWHSIIGERGLFPPDYFPFLDEPVSQSQRDRYPYYSTEIAAAWDVVEKLTGGMVQFRLERTHSGITYAKFVDCHEPETVIGASADTAPLAICLAAIKAVESQKGR